MIDAGIRTRFLQKSFLIIVVLFYEIDQWSWSIIAKYQGHLG